MSDARDMIAACFRHQHPEAFDRAMVDAPQVPGSLIYGSDNAYPPTPPAILEEPSGHPDAQPIRIEDDTP